MGLPESDSEILLLHNPRCSTCRNAKALLEERGVDFSERLYLEEPLTREELEQLRKRLDLPAAAWVRPKEAAYAEAGLGETSGDAELLAAMASHPVLIQRPILVRGDRARLGRPPEALLELL